MSIRRRVLILGIDGASWKIIDKVFEWGGMPYLKHLVKSGKVRKGPLHSTMPPMTPPAWTSLATGVNPGKHGVYGFHRIYKRKEGFESHLMKSHDVEYPRIHEMVSLLKVPSVAINLPVTYPPWNSICNNCVVINDWMAPDIRIKPRELEPKFRHYFIEGLEGSILKGTSRGSLKMIARRTHVFAEGVLELLNTVEWNLAFIVFSETDWAMHFNPDFVDGRRINEAFEVYNAIDKFLKEIHGSVDDIILVSDHGFTACDHLVNIPYFLKKSGLAKVGFHETLALRFGKTAVPPWLVNFVRSRPRLKALVYKIINLLGKNVSIEERKRIIPYDMAKVIMPDVGILYAAPGHEEEVLRVLRNIPEIQSILKGSEIYWGPHVSGAPDYLLMPEKPYCIYSKSDKPYTEENTAHHPIGMFGVLGDHLDEIWWKDLWEPWDVVPLALKLLELPIPANTDGYYPEGLKKYNYFAKWRIAKRARMITK